MNLYDYTAIPTPIMEGLARYIKDRIETGSFLRACLENDLHCAVMLGAPGALEHLPALMRFIYNECPRECWGSKEKVATWLRNEADPVPAAI